MMNTLGDPNKSCTAEARLTYCRNVDSSLRSLLFIPLVRSNKYTMNRNILNERKLQLNALKKAFDDFFLFLL